jgi:imidazolonepropionase-like amidohydrolase
MGADPAVSGTSSYSGRGPILLLGGGLWDGHGDGLVDDAAILVDDRRRIGFAGPRSQLGERGHGVECLDLRPATLMPGLIDAHMHFFGVDALALDELVTKGEAAKALFAARDARRLLDAGFTTVRDLGSTVAPALALAIAEGLIEGPRVVYAGQFICPTNGAWDHLHVPLSDMARLDMIVDGPDAARAIVRRRLRVGAGVIKLGISRGPWSDEFRAWGDDPSRQVLGFSLPELHAIVDEAHRAGVPVTVHAVGDGAVNQALDAEVDQIEHAHGINTTTRERLAASGRSVCPTLSHMARLAEAGSFGVPPGHVAAARNHRAVQPDDLRRTLEAGIPIVGGSDFIGPPWNPHGENAIELELMVDAGVPPARALAAMTSGAADALGLGDTVGTLRAGFEADVIAVDGDPLTDVTVCRSASFVMQGGRIVRRVAGSLRAGSEAGR